METSGATVWWIERATGEVRQQHLGAHSVPQGGTYKYEVTWKYAGDPIEMVTILDAQAGTEWANRQIEQLMKREAEMRATLVSAAMQIICLP